MNDSFEKIIENQKKSLTTSLTVFIALFAAGAILLIAKYRIGWLFIVMAAVLGASLRVKSNKINEELAKTDLETISREFAADGTGRFGTLSLTITPNYAVTERPAFHIYPLRDMEKFEVGLAGDVRKVLFLTDRSGERHKIAETTKGDAAREDFDRAYEMVREYFKRRENQ